MFQLFQAAQFNEQAPVLSIDKLLAKTINGFDERKPGVDVVTHCVTVGEVAKEIVNNLPDVYKNSLPDNVHVLCALHDIGKISPTYAARIYINLDKKYRDSDVEALIDWYQRLNVDENELWGGHAGAGEVFLRGLVGDNYSHYIVGAHHSGNLSSNVSRKSIDLVFGGEAWHEMRMIAYRTILNHFGVDALSKIYSPLDSKLVLGLMQVSDYIASSDEFADPSFDWKFYIKESVINAGIYSPKMKKGLSFSDIFDGKKPLVTQSKFIKTVTRPGVYVLESTMGSGKTEAAFEAARKMLLKGVSNGIVFATPTQVTANKIHDRFFSFIEKTVVNPFEMSSKVKLIHGNSYIERLKSGLFDKDFFDYSKRGLLSRFAVSTLDQLLLSVLNVKHNALRCFGLYGKVVILDEVHTYDAYTGTIMNELINQLREMNCVVIILSATLSKKQKEQMLRTSIKKQSYPMITALKNGKTHESGFKKFQPEINVAVRRVPLVEKAMLKALEKAKKGQQVLMVMNTVDASQRVYEAILDIKNKNEIDIEVGLIHSRYTSEDRLKNENHWIDVFGKDGKELRSKVGRILIGTQVLEQSIDIDADYLISEICPIDMLVQRIGRLWRHKNKRPAGSKREVLLISDTYENYLEQIGLFLKTRFVYSEFVLLRTVKCLEEMANEKGVIKINIPKDIRPMIEFVYSDHYGDSRLNFYRAKISEKIKALKSYAMYGLSYINSYHYQEHISTRYSDEASTQILLVQNIERLEKGFELILLNGKKVTINGRFEKNTAIELQNNIVKAMEKHAPNVVKTADYPGFDKYFFESNEGELGVRILEMTKLTKERFLTIIDGDLYSYGVEGYRKGKQGV